MLAHSQNEQAGKTFIDLLLKEKDYDRAYSYFDDSLASKIPKEQLNTIIQQIEGQLGTFNKILQVSGTTTLIYYSQFEKSDIDIELSFGQTGKIVGFFFKPHKVERKEHNQDDFLINSGAAKLKGILLVPEKDNQKKLVILIPGSGPQDRDETTIDNKPFRDLAEGLLTFGISSYRFDKRTLSDPESFSVSSGIDDEYTSDVINIIKFFKTSQAYKDYEIILLGHSQGGYMLPRIAVRDNAAAKLIFLAANARSLDELILEQYRYLSGLAGNTPEYLAEIDKVSRQVDYLRSNSFTPDSAASSLPLGMPFAYWKSILDYRPIEDAKQIKVPVLVLQGERDYQVTMKDFNLWKNAISSKGSKFITYPKLNHLFISGEGVPNPEEYLVKGTVDKTVIKDVASFILSK